MKLSPNTFDILNALRKVAFSKKAFVMPEILMHCAVARADAVKTIASRVRKGADALPYAHFFDIVYTDADVRRFITAFADSAPDDYVQDADFDIGMPWCMPWTWESAPLTAKEEDTPESLARRYVSENYKAIQQTFRDWKELDEENH